MQIDRRMTPKPEWSDIDIDTQLVAAVRDSEKLGGRKTDLEFDVKNIMQHAHDLIAAVAPHAFAEARSA